APQHVTVGERRQHALVRGARIQDRTARSCALAARHSPRRIRLAFDAKSDRDLVAENLHFTDDATAATPAPGTARVAIDLVAPYPQRIGRFDELRRIVLLCDEIDRVVAVGRGTRAV